MLVQGKEEPGYHKVVWHGKDESSREVPSGIYLARLCIPPSAVVTPEYSKSI